MTALLHRRWLAALQVCGIVGLLIVQPACRTIGTDGSTADTRPSTRRKEALAAPTAAQVAAAPRTARQAGPLPPAAVAPVIESISPEELGVAASDSAENDATTDDVNSDSQVKPVLYDPPTLPPQAYTGRPGAGSFIDCPPEGEEDPNGAGPWQPDGLYGPYPYDEYIFDGGDRDVPVKVDRDWTVRGIDQEDTIAHYDTLQGRREVTPSNRVPIYAPRFASVRKVYGLELHGSYEQVARVDNPVRLHSQEANRIVTTKVQPVQPILQHNLRSSVALRDQTRGVGIENAQLLLGFSDTFLPFEDFRIIRRGQFDSNEKARLSERIQAAIQWTRDQSVQVTLEGAQAYEGKGTNRPGETLLYEMPPGKPRLRIIKVASKSEAQPGEEVDFTLRFDNVGDQRIGNITIIDSLTTRLEYVPETAQCDLPARFATVENEAESKLLRWEIQDPLDVGKGGIIRFKCKVR